MQQASFIVPAQSTAQQVFEWLLDRILRGDLAPGARLSETEIAAQVGVSRQPVREAFIRLTAAGLTEVRPQRGTFIGRISMRAVLSARLVREAVESDLIRILAAKPDADILAQLHTQLDDQRRIVAQHDVAGFIRLDDQFHRTLAAAAGHPQVWDVLEGLKAQMNRLRHITAQLTDQHHLIQQHTAIVAALGAGDADRAEQAMRLHLRQLLHDLPQTAANRPEFFTH